MRKLDGKELKEIMCKYDISNIDLAEKIGYCKEHISFLRNGRYPITLEFQAQLCNYLVSYRGLDFEIAALITRLK
jgi:DNA-binding Xre family transcriptional regulator